MLDGVHSDPRLNIGLGRGFERGDAIQNDAVNEGVAILAVPSPCLDPNAFAQEVDHGSLLLALAKLCMALDRPLGTPDARAVIARFVGQKHDNLPARGAAKAARGAFICDAPAHDLTANWVEVRLEMPWSLGRKYSSMPLR